MLIDTHCHLNFNAFKDDCDEVIKKTLAQNIWLINVGSQFSTSQRAVVIANNYAKGVWAAVGLHPIHLFETFVDEVEVPFQSRVEDFDYERYYDLAQDKKVVAIGECGLDYFHLPKNIPTKEVKAKQKKVFKQHLDLAQKLKKPLVLHCRGSKDDPLDAYLDILAILKEDQIKIRGVIHCFAADLTIAKEFLLLGLKISFTGVITFKNAGKLREVISAVPLDKIMVETDSPYISPEPVRGERNQPFFVTYIAKKIAEVKKVGLKEVEEATTLCAKELFNLPR